jgi:hypothetical protein
MTAYYWTSSLRFQFIAIRIKALRNTSHFRFSFPHSQAEVNLVICWRTQSVPPTKLTKSALSKRRHSVWPTSWNMLWSFNVSKRMLDTLSVQFVWWKIAMEFIPTSRILQLWGWLSWSRTPSPGIHRTEKVKVVDVTPSATR